MRALRIHGPGDLRLDDVAPPGKPGPGEVLVAPVVGGICGTDVSMYRGPRPFAEPQILCHEFAGEVVGVGDGVGTVSAGDRVSVVPIDACGQCETCRRGRGELCPGHQSVGISHPWGGFGEFALLHEAQVAKLPDGVTWEQAALVEPLSVATTGVVRAGVGAGDRVLITGAGPIGALAVLAAQNAGAADIVVSEPAPGRAERVRKLGAEVVDPQAVDVAEFCRERSGGAGFDAAVDCAGNAAALRTAIASVRPTGRVAVTAVHGKPVELDVRDLLRRSITLAGAVAYPLWSWRRTLDQIAAGKLPVERVVTAQLPVEAGPTAFDRLVAPGDDVKILLEFGRR